MNISLDNAIHKSILPNFKGQMMRFSGGGVHADDYGASTYYLIDKNNNYHGGYYNYNSDNYQTIKSCRDLFHPNSYIQESIYGDHSKVYFADPNEGITPEIWKNAGYIVYDGEPSYPDVNKEVSLNYFGDKQEHYEQHYDTVKKYFKRVEDADNHALEDLSNSKEYNVGEKIKYYNGRIEYAKIQQEIAETCKQLYNKGADLRKQKDKLEGEKRWLDLLLTSGPEGEENKKNFDYATTYKRLKQVVGDIANIKEQLVPYFKQLQAFYEKKGIKVIKNI